MMDHEFDLSLPPGLVQRAVSEALAEDLGLVGDITTVATVPASAMSNANFVARRAGVISGLQMAAAAFTQVDGRVRFAAKVADGNTVKAGEVIATVAGPARGILTGERVALNFLGRMSGIATLTAQYVAAVAGTRARIADTRKTTPGLRAFEKYAVRCGGGMNHRAGLFDAILIKDNHIVAAGGIAAALAAAKRAAGHLVKIEIEVDTLEQLDEVIKHGADVVLLDNMTPDQLWLRCIGSAGG